MTKTILIVDDNAGAAALTRMALSMLDMDFRLESVSSGKETIKFLQAARTLPAMILLDLKLPGMNGIETLGVIRADERLKDIPVIITTYSSHEGHVEDALAAGASGFICKPIRLEEFSRDLEQHVTHWIIK